MTVSTRRGLLYSGLAALAAVGLTLTVVLASLGEKVGGGTDTTPPGDLSTASSSTSTAPTAETTMAGGLVDLLVISGHSVIDSEFRVDFVLSYSGDYWFKDPRGTAAFDASTLTLQSSSELGDVIVQGVSPAGPDFDHAHRSYVRADTMAWSIEVLTSGLGTPTEYLGEHETLWVAQSLGDSPGAEVTVIADSETGLPLLVSEAGEHGSTWEMTYNGTALVPKTTFDLGIRPEGADHRRDMGFRLVGLESLDASAGYLVPLPTWLPPGFEVSSVAFAEAPITGVSIYNPPSEKVAVVTYRNGLRALTVTTRLATEEYLYEPTGEKLAWTDPYCTWPPCSATLSVSTAGTEFLVSAGPYQPTHAWGLLNGLIVTVGGDVSIADLEAILASM